MSRKALLITLSYLTVALVAASPAATEPPVLNWQRDDGGATFQEWYFGTDDTTPAPDDSYNPYATDNNPVRLRVETDHGWYGSLSRGEGVWVLSGEIDTVIPNRPEPNPYKEIVLELTWKPLWDVPDNPFTPDPFLPDTPSIGAGSLIDGQNYSVAISYALGDPDSSGWYHTSAKITIEPNPPIEYISIKGNILVDSLSVDTICVPEPTTIAFLAAGGLYALLPRKRKK